MKKSYALLIGLVCSFAFHAQAAETEWQDANAEIASEDVYIEDSITGDNLSIDDLSEEALLQIRSDCAAIAESEDIEDEYLMSFIETCIADSINIELAGNQEGSLGVEIPVEEYIETVLEEGSVASID